MDTVELLRRSHLFGSLDDEALGELASIGVIVEFKRGKVLLEQEGPADYLYVLGEGSVGIRTFLREHGELLVETISHDGDIFGWSALVEPYVYAFTARAQEDGYAVAFPRQALISFLEARPEVGLAVYRRLVKTIAHRLHETRTSLMTVLAQGTISHG